MATCWLLHLLLSILWIELIYGFSYIVEEWGGISLPLRTQYCQHIFPPSDFAIYECDETTSGQQIMRKTVKQT